MTKSRSKPIAQYTLEDFNDAITYTKLLAMDAPEYAVRANAKLASAYVDMMDLVEPGWRQIVYEQLIQTAKQKGVRNIEVGNVGFEASGKLSLSTDTVLIGLNDSPDLQ